MSDKVKDAMLFALNQIDDYFEYRYESERDKAFVSEVLGELYDSLQKIQPVDEEER